MINLGIIGFGRFGQFAAQHLRHHVHLFVWDMRDQRKKAASLGLTWGTLEEAASCQVVLLSVPVSDMPTALAQVGPYLRPGAILMDVCSVKMMPVEWMKAAAPAEVDIIGAHPLFGPRSGRSGIAGLTVVLCPARATRDALVRRFLESLGLKVVVTTPEDHDRQMAYAQALTHFVARGLAAAGVQDQELKTPSYDRLLRVVEPLARENPELFRDLQQYNPYSAEARARLLTSLRHLDAEALEG
jgi:prephenate dehydrogenase